MILFLDTEFTGLDQPRPKLISIGLVSENGEHWFYAETPPDSYREQCSPWVVTNVLPLLEGGKYVMPKEELGRALAAWLVGLGNVVVVCDSPDHDFPHLRALLSPWPGNVDGTPIQFDEDSLDCGDLVAERQSHLGRGGYQGHHALHDANSLRDLWLVARRLAAFQPFVERLARVHPQPDLKALVAAAQVSP